MTVETKPEVTRIGAAARVFDRPWLALLLLFLVVVAVPLPVREVMSPDESRFAHQAQNMKESRDFIVPRIGDVPNADKPPVLFWAINLASLPFDRVNEVTSRIPSAVAALVFMLLTVRLGRRLFGSAALGFAAAAMVLTGDDLAQRAQWVSCDMPLSALVLLAITCWREALFEDDPPRGALLVGWLAAGFACLTKGPVGILWPVFWICAEAAARGAWRRVPRVALSIGPVLFAVLVFGWLGLFSAHAGLARGHEALVTQNVNRYLHPWNNFQPPWYYFYQTPIDWLPWTLFAPAAFVLARRSWRATDEKDRIATRTALVFFLVGFVFFSISPGKRGVYLLPSFAAPALLLARVFVPGSWGSVGPAWRRVPLVVIACFGAVVGLVLPSLVLLGRIRAATAFLPRAGYGFVIALALMGLSLLCGALVALREDRRGNTAAALRAMVIGCAMLWLSAGTFGGASWSRFQNGRAFGAQVDAVVPKGERLLVERGKFELVLFYSGRHGTEFEDNAMLLKQLREGTERYVVTSTDRLKELAAAPEIQKLSPRLDAWVGNTEFVVLGP